MTKEEAIEQLKWYFEYDDGTASESVTKEAYKLAIEALKQPKKTGKWLGASDGYDWYGKCSCCRAEININSWYTPFNYCPKCGAKMEEE